MSLVCISLWSLRLSQWQWREGAFDRGRGALVERTSCDDVSFLLKDMHIYATYFMT
jgi:hypothetical protein